MQQKAYAKLNLTLGITGQRADGYHLLDTIFCPIDLCDTLSVRANPNQGLSLSCTDAKLTGSDNLVLRAAQLFSQAVKQPLSLHFHLDKRIPVQSGLGGGSADAAAALKILSNLFPNAVDSSTLLNMALFLGADVPYALLGGMQRARGIGERLTPIQGVPALSFVILKPETGLSTPDVFHAYDTLPQASQPDVAGSVCALKKGDFATFARLCKNVLQDAAQALCPSIETLCTVLMEKGAECAAMTGTGSAVFGLFADASRAQSAAHALRHAAPFCIFSQSLPCGE